MRSRLSEVMMPSMPSEGVMPALRPPLPASVWNMPGEGVTPAPPVVLPPPPWPLPEPGELFAVQNSTVSRLGCSVNVAEGENAVKLKGSSSDKDFRNCNGKRVVEIVTSVESRDLGGCGVDGLKRARPSIEKMGDEKYRSNRWGVDRANGGMNQPQCGQSVESGLGDRRIRLSVDGKGIDGMKESHFKNNFEARMVDQRIREKGKARAIDGLSRHSHFKKNFESRMGDQRITEKEKARAIDGLSRQSHSKKNFESRMGDQRITEKEKARAIDGLSRHSHFKKNFESRMGDQRITEKEKARTIDGLSRHSHFKKNFESRMADQRITEKEKARAIDGLSRQSHSKKNFEPRMGDQRIREKEKARAIDGIEQSPHSKKSFEAIMGDRRIRGKMKTKVIDGISRQFQSGRQSRRKWYNKMGNGASGRLLESAAFNRATSSLNEETGPNEPVGNSGRSLGMKMGSGNQRCVETNKQVLGRASRGAGVRLHGRAVKLFFMKPKCKLSMKSSARIVDEQDITKGNGLSCLPKKSGILREGDSNYPESSQGRERAMGLKSEANCSSMQGASDREKVKKVLSLFRLCWNCLLEEAKADDMIMIKRVDARAYEILRQRNCFVNTGEPILGNVPGVEVGDEFQYRLELCVIGLHRPTVNGIDYIRGRRNLATSIVSSGVYDDIIFDLGTIIYTGEGGRPKAKISLGDDQQLTNGNLALKNSMVAGSPVRVIRGIRKPLRNKMKKTRPSVVIGYIYYGLYVVEEYWSEIGLHGFLEYKFQLRRMPGQPQLTVAEGINCRKWKPKEDVFVDGTTKKGKVTFA